MCSSDEKLLDLIGQKFGKLTALSVEFSKKTSKNSVRRHWKCQCDCGNIVYIRRDALLDGSIQSCGCHSQEVKKRKKGQRVFLSNAPFNLLFSHYEYRARKRGHFFDLSKDDFLLLTKGNCFYCGAVPRSVITVKNSYETSYVYNGIDRIDSSKGYVLGNVVSCCGICNMAKGKQSTQQFETWISELCKYRMRSEV